MYCNLDIKYKARRSKQEIKEKIRNYSIRNKKSG